MIRHCLRLVWNRKRTNLLVTLEIFFSFLVMSAVVVMASVSPTLAPTWKVKGPASPARIAFPLNLV